MTKKIFFLYFAMSITSASAMTEKAKVGDKQVSPHNNMGGIYNYDLFKTRVMVRAIAANIIEQGRLRNDPALTGCKNTLNCDGRVTQGLCFTASPFGLTGNFYTPWGSDKLLQHPSKISGRLTQSAADLFVQELTANGIVLEQRYLSFDIASINGNKVPSGILTSKTPGAVQEAMKAAELQLAQRYKKEAIDEVVRFVTVTDLAAIVVSYCD